MGLRLIAIGIIGLCLTGVYFAFAGTSESKEMTEMSQVDHPGAKSEEEWKHLLNKETFCVMREKGTEKPFTGKYWNHREVGNYHCAACGAKLFASTTKYNSGSGWPSFWKADSDKSIRFVPDTSYGMNRTEVLCARCGGHLGHIFNDGPPPTGQRYCINSASLKFVGDRKKDSL